MMKIINNKNNKTYNRFIKNVYKKSFPENEQVPFSMLSFKARKKGSDLFAIIDEEEFIGMLCTVYEKDIVFLWYLAIVEDKRGRGYGSAVLKWAKQTYKNHRLILNIEEASKEESDYESRIQRKQFYIKNGFQECGFKTEEYGVVYEMLYYGNNITYDEYKSLMISYNGEFVFNKIYKLVQ